MISFSLFALIVFIALERFLYVRQKIAFNVLTHFLTKDELFDKYFDKMPSIYQMVLNPKYFGKWTLSQWIKWATNDQ